MTFSRLFGRFVKTFTIIELVFTMDFWFCFSSDNFDNVPGICAGFDLDLRVKNLDRDSTR